MNYFKKIDVILTILIIIDILLILGSVLFNLSKNLVGFILVFDSLLCIILIIYFIMKLRRSQDKKLFFTNHWLELFASFPVALLVMPILSSTLYAYNAIVLIRFLRLILLFKVLSKFFERILDATYLDKIIAAFIVIVLSSTLILYYLDPNITSIFAAIWFIFQTVTTVGYGDVVPTSHVGQFIGLILLIVGVLMFSVMSASFAYIFNERVFKKNNDEYIQKISELKSKVHETRESIDEIKERTISNEDELAEIKENVNNLSQQIDYLIEIVEKK